MTAIFVYAISKIMSERPIECGQCKRPVKVIYKEVLNGTPSCTEMCQSCPILEEKLHGTKEEIAKGLACKHCGTSLEQILTGGPVGCTECYHVFEKQILSDLIATDCIPPFLQKKKELLHVGRVPHEAKAPPIPSKLLALKEALTDALKRENYEQAALIRDQIKTLSQEKL